ncbi:MAG TPA: hypothetical protein VEF04_22105 [Blastocatellia bacterium]|nr:hypothetical protein [Blastocatellia bacterium]
MSTPTRENTFIEEASALGQRAYREEKQQTANNVVNPADSAHTNVSGLLHNWMAGTFHDRASAERAYNSMLSRGYDEKDINLIMSDKTRKMYFSDQSSTDLESGNKAMAGACFGGALGVTSGAILAALTAIGTSTAIPGLGLVIAGPIAVALAGAGAGAVTGSLIGMLIGSGLPEERAKLYETGLKSGDIILGISPHNEADAAYFEQHFEAQGKMLRIAIPTDEPLT